MSQVSEDDGIRRAFDVNPSNTNNIQCLLHDAVAHRRGYYPLTAARAIRVLQAKTDLRAIYAARLYSILAE